MTQYEKALAVINEVLVNYKGKEPALVERALKTAYRRFDPAGKIDSPSYKMWRSAIRSRGLGRKRVR